MNVHKVLWNPNAEHLCREVSIGDNFADFLCLKSVMI